MARKKIRLELITKRSTRKATLKKRKEGLIKKVRELVTLCAVNAFIIISSPDDPETKPVTWPLDSEIEHLVTRFRSLSILEQSKKRMDQEIYLKEKLSKDQEQLKRIRRRNEEKERNYLMHRVNDDRTMNEFSMNELQRVVQLMAEKKKDVKRDLNCFQQVQLSHSHDPGRDQVIGQSSDAHLLPNDNSFPEPLGWDQWFINMLYNKENRGASSSIQSSVGFSYDMVMPHQSFIDRSSNYQMLQSHQTMGFRHPCNNDSPGTRMLPSYVNMAREVSGNDNNFEANIGTSNGLQGLPHMNYNSSPNTMISGNSLIGVSHGLLHESDNHATEGDNDQHSNRTKP